MKINISFHVNNFFFSWANARKRLIYVDWW